MNLGFIGTGKIASSVITGICTSKIFFNKIMISPRNKNLAKNLKQKFKKVIIAKNNQQIVDKCEWVFLSVTPTVGDKIIKELNHQGLEIYSLPKNLGPSAARNLGLKKAKGEYIFFMDVDDTIDPKSLKLLYDVAIKNDCDFVFSDFKRIENAKNLRENFFNYSLDKLFNTKEINNGMREQVHFNSFGHLGLFGINGRLLLFSIILHFYISFFFSLRFFLF